MARKVKITIEIDAEDLLYVMNGGSDIAVASEGEGDLIPESGTDGDNNNNNNNNGNNNTSGDKETTGRPGVGTGMTGPGRPEPDSEGNE